MRKISDFRKDTQTTCTCCDLKIKPCPRCGEDGVIIRGYESTVYCDSGDCEINMDFGHWCGTQDDKDAIHFVIENWNERPQKPEVS